MSNKNFYRILFILLCINNLMGCERKEIFTDLEQHIAQIKMKKIKHYQQQENVPIQLPTALTYQMASIRSPFQSTITNNLKIKPSSNPLQTYSVSMLRFVGTLSHGRETIAYVLAPNNLVYTVREGNLIGIEGGVVLRVQPKQLKILEAGVDNGKKIKRTITLQLKEER